MADGTTIDQFGRILQLATSGLGAGYTYDVLGYAPVTYAPPPAPSAVTGVNPTETQYALYGHIIPLSVLGIGRIGGDIIAGPWVENGLASWITSFGVPADASTTRTLKEIAFDSEVVWDADTSFSTEAFTYRFYGGTFSQSADALETSHFGADAVAYRPQILIAFENIPLAGTKFGKIPYVSAVIEDSAGTDVNLGEAFERLAYSPYVGYTSAQFETVGITDGLPDGGLIINQEIDFLTLAKNFGRFYPTWDILQTDKLRIVDRGDDVDADIVLNKQTLMTGLVVNRQGPDTVSKDLELSTIDPDADFTIVPSRAQRPRDPVAVTASIGTDSAYLPAIMESSTRQAIVTLAKYHEEQTRKTISGTAMAYGLEMEPGDLVAITDIGDQFENEIYKVVETLHGANNVVEFTAAAFLKCDVTIDDDGEIVVPPITTAWNPLDKSTGFTLTNSNRTANNNGIHGGVRSTTSHTTGKWYFELSIGTFNGNLFNSDGIGLMTGSHSLVTDRDNDTVVTINDGRTYIGGYVDTMDAITGCTLGYAVDLTHQKLWIRSDRVSNTWHGSGPGANPATNTNGFDISGIFGGSAAYIALYGWSGTTDIVTINSTFTYTPPVGFDPW